jgi:hypothetical protein
MKPLDYAKALGLAVAVLAIDVAIAIGVVYLWSVLMEPGHPRAYYETAGIPIARLSTRIFGTALLFGAAWLFSRRAPRRNPYIFVAALLVFYALIDAASAGFVDVLTLSFGFTISLKLLGALAGAMLAVRDRSVAVRP